MKVQVLEKCRVQKLALTKEMGAIAGVKDEERQSDKKNVPVEEMQPYVYKGLMFGPSEASLEISLERPLSRLSCRVNMLKVHSDILVYHEDRDIGGETYSMPPKLV